jgi:hypothetical protein
MTAVDAGKRLRFRVFGTVAVIRGDEQLALGRLRDRCLLGVLLLTVNRVIDIDTVVHLFWGEQQPRSARTQVKNSAGRLRKATTAHPDVELLTVGSGYQLVADPLSVDLHRAIHLGRRARYEPSPTVAAGLVAAALSLWRQPVLADIPNDRVHKFAWSKVGQDLTDLLALRQEFEDRDAEQRTIPS